jgi:hypothetical protein
MVTAKSLSSDAMVVNYRGTGRSKSVDCCLAYQQIFARKSAFLIPSPSLSVDPVAVGGRCRRARISSRALRFLGLKYPSTINLLLVTTQSSLLNASQVHKVDD